MKTNLINSTFVGITFLLIAGCASTTQAPSTTTLGHCKYSRVVGCLLRSG